MLLICLFCNCFKKINNFAIPYITSKEGNDAFGICLKCQKKCSKCRAGELCGKCSWLLQNKYDVQRAGEFIEAGTKALLIGRRRF